MTARNFSLLSPHLSEIWFDGLAQKSRNISCHVNWKIGTGKGLKAEKQDCDPKWI